MDIPSGAAAGTPEQAPVLRKDWRFYTGMTALVLSFVFPLLGLLIPLLGLPTAVTAVLMTVFVVGGPEVLTIAAVALLGKETLHYFLGKLKQTLWRVVFVQPVSRTRYYVGLTIFMVSIIPLYLAGYVPWILPEGEGRLYILVAGDLSFLGSMFLMGGEFWEKVRKIFVWEGKG